MSKLPPLDVTITMRADIRVPLSVARRMGLPG